MARRVGIHDVATAAGVSVTTVSHALNDRGQVSAATRERVKLIAAELGYAPNRIASALRGRRSRLIGFVSDEIASTPFAGRLIAGAQDAASELDLLLMAVDSHGGAEVERRQIDALLAQQVDAIVYARMYHQYVDPPAALHTLPSILVDAVDRADAAASIVPDEQQIGALATEHLLAAGHRRIVQLTIEEPSPAREGRESGFREALADRGLTGAIVRVPGIADADAGRRAAQRAFDAHPGFTAAVCFNDQMAMGLYQVAGRHGLVIPEQLSVVGIDDFLPVSAGLDPGLTTVALPHYEMGRLAIERLEEALRESAAQDAVVPGGESSDAAAGPASMTTRLQCRLVVRDSVASPAAE
ncbi:LacI family DNA-binding transcriptional regulator [Schumannella sp. 10F1B-5-1]|uniref:LacI family DNA-binding transcriptional regulator n=1 Tax=Schumannella sp. 10F1B-5-1 TaxID=2590780 RepID=UPI001130B0D3|nr:LacI family DNA-binding transcriptional regulator [Schumannella sp. 10F1B-5-1]TPW73465.1 LacI family DNA-binding transcriptional regulator [Schumannella sp. 10F1B-5-1]